MWREILDFLNRYLELLFWNWITSVRVGITTWIEHNKDVFAAYFILGGVFLFSVLLTNFWTISRCLEVGVAWMVFVFLLGIFGEG